MTAVLSSVTTEGGLLHHELLERVVRHDPKLAGLTPGDFHLEVPDGTGHVRSPQLKFLPSAASFTSSGAGCHDGTAPGSSAATRSSAATAAFACRTSTCGRCSAFCDTYAPAGELMRGGTMQGDLKGAPLRCSLGGARWARAGLLATGEAIGSTYPFTGEGIGKAMETGLLAAQALTRQSGARSDADITAAYEASLRALKPRFDLYERANRVNQYPWLADLLIWRAQRSERLRRRMADVLEETSNPGHLVTVKGMFRLFTE